MKAWPGVVVADPAIAAREAPAGITGLALCRAEAVTLEEAPTVALWVAAPDRQSDTNATLGDLHGNSAQLLTKRIRQKCYALKPALINEALLE